MVDRMLRWLLAERKPSFLYALAAVAGLAMAWYLLGWDGIQGTSRYWETTHNDSVQAIAAVRYYLAEPWTWRILDVPSYGQGTNLILSDSVPILAVPAKLVRFALPAGFHYFGYWVAFCFVMQSVAAVAILVELRWRNYLAMVAALGLALTQTVLLQRYFHVALMAQFLILLTIVLGIRIIRGARPHRALIALLSVVAAAFFVHLYLCAMVAALALGFVLQAGILGRISWRSVAAWLAATSLGTAVLISVTGLTGAASVEAGGLGQYSMNVLAPVLGSIDATGGQYEGYSYIGLGSVVVLAVAVVLGRDHVAIAMRRYWAPLLAALLMTVFALSPVIWVGETWQIDVWWGPAEWFGNRFRSTGRFVWPLVYMVIPGALYVVYRRLDRRWAACLLLAAVVVQVADMAPFISEVRGIYRRGEETLLAPATWNDAIAAHDLVRIVPQQCVLGQGTVALANREVQRLAALAGTPITAAAVARAPSGCAENAYERPVVAGELRIAWDAVFPGYRIDGAECVSFDLGTACSAGEDEGQVDLLRSLAQIGG